MRRGKLAEIGRNRIPYEQVRKAVTTRADRRMRLRFGSDMHDGKRSMRLREIDESSKDIFADRGSRIAAEANEIVVENLDEVGALRKPRLNERLGFGRSGDGRIWRRARGPAAGCRRTNAGNPQVRQLE